MIMCVLLCYPVSIHMSQLQATGRPISSFTSYASAVNLRQYEIYTFDQYCSKYADFVTLDSEKKFHYILKNHHKILVSFIMKLWEYRKVLLYK